MQYSTSTKHRTHSLPFFFEKMPASSALCGVQSMHSSDPHFWQLHFLANAENFFKQNMQFGTALISIMAAELPIAFVAPSFAFLHIGPFWNHSSATLSFFSAFSLFFASRSLI